MGGAIYFWLGGNVYIEKSITLQECYFYDNLSGRGAALCIDIGSIINTQFYSIMILNSTIYHNLAYDSIVYMTSKNITLSLISTNFTDNAGSCVHLLQSHLICKGVVFAHNTADNGAALFIDQGSSVAIGDEGAVQLINNSAIEHGGAIYLNLVYDCPALLSIISSIYQKYHL